MPERTYHSYNGGEMFMTTSVRAGFTLVAITAGAGVLAQPSTAWVKTIGFTLASQTAPKFLRTDSGGNTFVVRTRGFRNCDASTGFLEVQKVSPAGATLWTAPITDGGSGLGQPAGLAVDSTGSPITVYFDFLSFFTSTARVTKLNGATGAQVWNTRAIPNFYFRQGIAVDSANNVYLGGQTAFSGDIRMAVAKLNGSTGALLWAKPVARTAVGQSDFVRSINVDSTGNTCVVGLAESSDPCNTTFKSPLVVSRLRNTDGASLWVKNYTALATDDNLFPALASDSSGNVFVGATVYRNPATTWVTTKFLAANGNLAFAKQFAPTSPILSMLTQLAVDGAGGVTSGGNSFGMTGQDVFLLHHTSTGSQNWTRTLPNQSMQEPFISPEVRNELIAIGNRAFASGTRSTYVAGHSGSQAAVNAVDTANGNVLWGDYFYATSTERTSPAGITRGPAGDPVIAYQMETGNPINPIVQSGVARMNATNGSSVFNSISSNAVISTPDVACHLVVDPTNGDIYTTGGSAGRIVTQRYNSAGTLLWTHTEDNAAFSQFSDPFGGGKTIVRDPSGNPIVIGTNRHQAVAQKLNKATGAVYWTTRWSYTPGETASVNSVGDVYIPFHSPSVCVKLAGATGTILWTSTINPPLQTDHCRWVALDSTGSPFVGGETVTNTTCPDRPDERFFVQRLNPTNGVKVWERVLVGPATGHNSMSGLFVDSAKNVLFAGSSYGGATKSDYFAAKLNGATGSPMWSMRFEDLNKVQHAAAAVLDGSGNLFITGASYSGLTSDGVTIKVLNSNGAKAWANKLLTPTGARVPCHIARDGANNIYVGGLIGNPTVAQHFGQKINGSTGATIWTELRGSALGSLENFGTSVAVSSTNQMHIFCTEGSAGVGLGNMALIQYKP